MKKEYTENKVPNKKKKQIAVMLDLERTSEDITEKTAEIFIKQLEFIRHKFLAEEGRISISTHYGESDKIQKVLNILAKHTTDTIKIGLSFYYGGIFDYEKQLDLEQGYSFNRNKIKTFEMFYMDSSTVTNEWFAIIDDGISEEEYKYYQNKQPSFFCRPSKNEYDLKYNSFMNIATTTKGMSGVIESLDNYIKSIENLSPEQILEKQKNMICHLSGSDLVNKIRNREYKYLEQYFKEGFADKADYSDTLTWLEITNLKMIPTKEEREQIKRILALIEEYYQYEEETQSLAKLRILRSTLFNENGK